MNKKFFGECKGKQQSFKDLKESAPEAKIATTQINIPAFTDSDSENESFNNTFNVMNVMREATEVANEFGFQENMAEIKIETPVNAETVPKYNELEKTALIADKNCIICLKGNMDLSDLSNHLIGHHSIYFFGEESDDPIQEWIDVAEFWKESG